MSVSARVILATTRAGWPVFVLSAAAVLLTSGCGPAPPASILLFCGEGASPNDVAAIEVILRERRLPYATADSAGLNSMTEVELSRYRLLIVPGGNYIQMGDGLTPTAARTVRDAVRGGVNYLGICAGAILAGDAPGNSWNLTAGVRFEFYAAVNDNIHKAAVSVVAADGTNREHYWEDGPQLGGWGDVVAKYPDDTPAVVQGACGQGWVVLCGVHPEAPESWREGMAFSTPASDDNDYAAELIEAALQGKRVPQF